MDIHKPKPWHGLREFLKEYLIIAVGVLTALAAEQVVEAMRWAERTRETEAQLRAELQSITVQAQGRLAILKCSNDMLDTVERALVSSGDDWRPPFVVTGGTSKAMVGAPRGIWETQAWHNAQAAGTANHLPQDEQLAFGDLYQVVERVRALNQQEEADISELNSLTVLKRLDATNRADYLRLIYRVRANFQSGVYYSQGILTGAADLKVTKGRLETYGGAMPLYQAACRQFYDGKKDIVLTPPSPGA